MAKTKIDKEILRELAQLLDETGLTEIEIEQNDVRLRVAKVGAMVAASVPGPAAAPAAGPAVAEEAKAAAVDAVKSPMVGTVYLAPAPGAANFVSVGKTVAKGDSLLIVEAMKTMNQIPAPKAGKVVEILVEDGQPVEFDEPLIVIE
ncbi:MAG TPA: acetyl-CoA carboxylase biotin carboxyl carrier protein [Rhizobiales bacterium]|nr:acetyl-CoA carboxylase biotin carboxyl carrier protein [Hyphomicrobiales bacterium]